LVTAEPTSQIDQQQEPATSRRRRILVAVLGALGLLVVGVYGAAWAAAGSGVPRGTTVLGVDIGGLSPAAAEQRLVDETASVAGQPLTVAVAGQELPLEPAKAGLSIDAPATVAEAGTRGFDPRRLLPALFGVQHDVAPVLTVDDATLGRTVAGIAAKVKQDLREGAIKFEDGKAVLVEPREGRTLDATIAADALRRAFLDGSSRAAVPVTTTSPTIGADEVRRAMKEFATPAMSGPVTLMVGDKKITLEPEAVGKHLSMAPDANKHLEPKLDAEKLVKALYGDLDELEREAVDARFVMSDIKPTILPSKEGREVDTGQLGKAVLAALVRPDDRVATVDVEVTQPKLTTERARSLGIKERLSTFTTRYPVVPYRVQNIGRAARLINGSVVLPGETWSLNGTVGERTVANGFTEGYIIKDGQFSKELGGGTSQVATTTFNAIFFAGLADVEHHPHSLYISRYPAGREATVAWGSKDLRFRNDSGNGVLIQATHSRGQITLSFWGTRKYDEIRSVSSDRYNHREPKTVYSDDPKCESQAPVAGFDIDVTRVFVDNGSVVKRERFHTSYKATDKIVCRKSDS
jgi:vancomycin resistance protein YoaR